MPLEILPLDQLNQDAVDQANAFATQRLEEAFPELNFRSGFMHSSVIRTHAALEAALQDVVDRHGRSRSLLEIDQDPALAEPGTVDAVLSNYGVDRIPGEASTGQVAVVLQSAVPVTVPKGFAFVGRGQTFTADEAYAARGSQAAILADTDRLLKPIGDGSGRFYFLISVTSVEVGSAARLRRRDQLDPVLTLPRFDSAYAFEDFTGGFDPETNAELLARLQDGAAAKTPANRMTTEALVRTTEAFQRTVAVSEIGLGDAEQIRYHGLIPVAGGGGGGRVDVYARTGRLPAELTIPKTAICASVADGQAVYVLSLTRDDAPGFYEVRSVVPSGSATAVGYELVADDRGFDLSGDDWRPDVESAAEAAYSRWQTAVVRFADPAPADDVVAGSTLAVDVVVAAMPQVADLDAFLTDRGRRPPGADLLVRAAVPVFVGLAVRLRKTAGQDDPDLDTIRTRLAEAVNSTGFVGRLTAASLAAVVQGVLTSGQSCDLVKVSGRLRRPDGTARRLPAGDIIEVPDEPKKMVTRRTACFILDPGDVEFSVTAEGAA